MSGTARDDDFDGGDSYPEEFVLGDTISSSGERASGRNSRRTLEQLLEERRLRRQLRDIFSDDDQLDS
jgi:hypothetical protein